MSGGWSWQRCEEACERVFAALDWRALGKLYFRDDGEARWQALAPRALALGFDWARALLQRVPQQGRSLHVGAGVAELPVLLAERLVRGRDQLAVNMRARECELIGAALQRCGLGREVVVKPLDAETAAEVGAFDHVGCVSVFTDPETWPLCSGVTYGRIAAVQLDVAAFTQERERARALAQRLFASLRRPGLISTTVEEAPWFLDAARAAGVAVAVDDATVATAVVGDAVGFLRVG